jgi:hypothetical protein
MQYRVNGLSRLGVAMQPLPIFFTKAPAALFAALLAFFAGMQGIYMLLHLYLVVEDQTTVLFMTACAPFISALVGGSFYGYLRWLDAKGLTTHPTHATVLQVVVVGIQVFLAVVGGLAMVLEPLQEVVGDSHKSLTTFLAVWGGPVSFVTSSMIICLAMNQVVIVDHLVLTTLAQSSLIVLAFIYDAPDTTTVVALTVSSAAFVWKVIRFYHQWRHYEMAAVIEQRPCKMNTLKVVSFLVLFLGMLCGIFFTFLFSERYHHGALVRAIAVFIVIMISLIMVIVSKTVTSRLKPILRLWRNRFVIFLETNAWAFVWIVFWALHETKTNHLHHLIWWAPVCIELVIFLRKVVRNVIAASYDDQDLDQYDFTISGAFQSFLDWIRELFLKSELEESSLSLPLVIPIPNDHAANDRFDEDLKPGELPV